MKPASLLFASLTCIGTLTMPAPSHAYPIDCAILLCLAGGFPASAECSAAKAEMIRRITPWPIEPPLQLWNCPMSVPSDLAAQIGLSNAGLGADGLRPEVRAYRDAVEIYHIKHYSRRTNNDGDVIITDRTERGNYGPDGSFNWVSASYQTGPAWLAQAVGGNRIGTFAYQFLIRGVAIRTRDYNGNYMTEWIPY